MRRAGSRSSSPLFRADRRSRDGPATTSCASPRIALALPELREPICAGDPEGGEGGLRAAREAVAGMRPRGLRTGPGGLGGTVPPPGRGGCREGFRLHPAQTESPRARCAKRRCASSRSWACKGCRLRHGTLRGAVLYSRLRRFHGNTPHPGHRARGNTLDTFFPPEVRARLESLGTVVWNDSGRQFSPEIYPRAFRAWMSASRAGARPPGRGGASAARTASASWPTRPVSWRGWSVRNSLTRRAGGERKPHIRGVRRGIRGGLFLHGPGRLAQWPREVQEGRWRTEKLLEGRFSLIRAWALSVSAPWPASWSVVAAFRTRIRVYDPFVPVPLMREAGVEPAPLRDVDRALQGHFPSTRPGRRRRATSSTRTSFGLSPTARYSSILRVGASWTKPPWAAELATGRFQAVLDVFQTEPLPRTRPCRRPAQRDPAPAHAGPTVDRRRLAR